MTTKFNVIFLDVDGVLNSEELSRSKNAPRCQGLRGISGAKLDLLVKLVKAADAKIVLASTWKDAYKKYLTSKSMRVDYDVYDPNSDLIPFGKYLVNKFKAKHLDIYATTLNYEHNVYWRGSGIVNYLKANKNKINNFVILDDEMFGDYKELNLLPHLVKTDDAVGLLEQDINKAIKILQDSRFSLDRYLK